MIDMSGLSGRYTIRRMTDADADALFCFCKKHTQFYRCCNAEPSKERVLNDLHITPPGIGPEDKYYVGFFQGDALVAVLDLIDGYPRPDAAFIGFFMVRQRRRHRHHRGNLRCSPADRQNGRASGHCRRQSAGQSFLEKERLCRSGQGADGRRLDGARGGKNTLTGRTAAPFFLTSRFSCGMICITNHTFF